MRQRWLIFSNDFIRQPWISIRCRFYPSPWLNFQRWFLVLQWLSFRWRFMDQHWHSVFDDSMPQTRIYFCYRFYASLVNSLTQSTPSVSCNSYFSSVFSNDFICQSWISIRCRFYPSPWLNFLRWFLVLQWLSFRWRFMDQHWHCVFVDSMPQTRIYFCCRFYASLVNSLTRSTPSVSCHSYFSGNIKVYVDSVFAEDFWSVVTQFSLMIPCVNDDTVFYNDFLRQPWISIRCRFYPSPWLNFQRWFLVLQWLSFRWRFMDQHWHYVFDDSMPQTPIYFCYRFYASLVNSLTQSTPLVSCHSYFSGNIKVYVDSVFADDFWSVVT